MMSTSLSTNWKQHYASLASNNDGNKMMMNFSKSITESLSDKDKINALTEETDSVIFIADDQGSITVIHSPTKLGGTRSRPELKIVCLVGMGPLATAVVLNDKQAIAIFKIATPEKDKFHDCTSAEQFSVLDVEDNEEGRGTRRGRVTSRNLTRTESSVPACFIPAPFLAKFVLEADSKKPADLVPAFLLAAK